MVGHIRRVVYCITPIKYTGDPVARVLYITDTKHRLSCWAVSTYGRLTPKPRCELSVLKKHISRENVELNKIKLIPKFLNQLPYDRLEKVNDLLASLVRYTEREHLYSFSLFTVLYFTQLCHFFET